MEINIDSFGKLKSGGAILGGSFATLCGRLGYRMGPKTNKLSFYDQSITSLGCDSTIQLLYRSSCCRNQYDDILTDQLDSGSV